MKNPVPLLRSATLRGRGHPAITARHPKTFEMTAETEITRRASCVLAVGTGFDKDALEEWSLLRGPVRLTLSATAQDGSRHQAVGEAMVNPFHNVADRVVIRRSALSDDTADDAASWATDSTLTAHDLDPGFVAALADPRTEVALVAEEIGDRRPLVLVFAAGDQDLFTGRALQLWASYDVRYTSFGPGPALRAGHQKTAEHSLADILAEREIVAVSLPSLTEPPNPTAAAYLAVAAKGGARFAILPPRPASQPAVEALLGAGLPVAPHAWLGSPQGLSELPAMATVFRMPPGVSPEVFGDRPIAIAESGKQDLGTAMRRVPAKDVVEHVGVLTVVGPSAEPGELVDLHAVARALADAGIAPRTLSEALTPFGLTRKKLYQLLKDSE